MEGTGKVSHKSLKWAQCSCTDAIDAHEALAWQPSSSAQSEWKWSPESAAQGETERERWLRWCWSHSSSRRPLLPTRFNKSCTVSACYWLYVKQKGQNFSPSHCEMMQSRGGLTVIVTLDELKGSRVVWNDGFVTAEDREIPEKGHPGQLTAGV